MTAKPHSTVKAEAREGCRGDCKGCEQQNDVSWVGAPSHPSRHSKHYSEKLEPHYRIHPANSCTVQSFRQRAHFPICFRLNSSICGRKCLPSELPNASMRRLGLYRGRAPGLLLTRPVLSEWGMFLGDYS